MVMKKYPEEDERNGQLEKKSQLTEQLQTEIATRLKAEAVAKAKAKAAAMQVMQVMAATPGGSDSITKS